MEALTKRRGTRKTTLETGGEDVKTTLETSGEDVNPSPLSSGQLISDKFRHDIETWQIEAINAG